MLLIIDNYDSFTYNLVQYLGELGAEMQIFRNDEITVRQAQELNPSRILVSPGPGIPDNAGVSIPLIKYFSDKIPILGVCLGHQAIGQFFGGKVVRAPEPIHGKPSDIYHDGKGLFLNLEERFHAEPLSMLCSASLAACMGSSLIPPTRSAAAALITISERASSRLLLSQKQCLFL